MSDTAKTDQMRRQFSDLHRSGAFLMPNAWDIGSARLFESLGFDAVATTSSGFAATLGRRDQEVLLGELAVHVADMCAAVGIPVSVDAEGGYATDTEGLGDTVELLGGAGAAGISIEDYLPGRGLLEPGEAVERVGAVVEAARPLGIVVTARAENHLYGANDLTDTIRRLEAYAEAGADVVYAPGLSSLSDIRRIVDSVGRPVNVLLLPGGPTVPELADVGIRRVSTGGGLAFLAYGAAARAGRQLLSEGTWDSSSVLTREERDDAFGG